MAEASTLFLISEMISFFIGAFVLWASAKILGGRLSLFLALAITIISTLFSRLSPIILPNLGIVALLIIGFILRIILISAFAQVGLMRAIFIAVFPTAVLILLALVLFGALVVL